MSPLAAQRVSLWSLRGLQRTPLFFGVFAFFLAFGTFGFWGFFLAFGSVDKTWRSLIRWYQPCAVSDFPPTTFSSMATLNRGSIQRGAPSLALWGARANFARSATACASNPRNSGAWSPFWTVDVKCRRWLFSVCSTAASLDMWAQRLAALSTTTTSKLSSRSLAEEKPSNTANAS